MIFTILIRGSHLEILKSTFNDFVSVIVFYLTLSPLVDFNKINFLNSADKLQ